MPDIVLVAAWLGLVTSGIISGACVFALVSLWPADEVDRKDAAWFKDTLIRALTVACVCLLPILEYCLR